MGNLDNSNIIYDKEMTETQFTKFSNSIKELCGINLTSDKKTMVEGRLRKRIKQLQFSTFRKYFLYLYSDEGIKNETKIVIDLISTNKTDFFREPKHFEFLRNTLLPKFYSKGIGKDEKLNIWCAASSSGEEPYSLAFILKEFQNENIDFNYKLISSDISTRVLKTALQAVYNYDRIEPIANELKQKYLLRGKNGSAGLVRIAPEIRKTVQFFRQNLTDSNYCLKEKQNIVFCRNVLIYFDMETKGKIINTIAKYMHKGSILVLGHAESLNGINIPFERIESTIYQRI